MDSIRQKVVAKEQDDLLYVSHQLYRELIEEVGQHILDHCDFERQFYLAIKYKDFSYFRENVPVEITSAIPEALSKQQYNIILTDFNYYFNI